MKQDVRCRVCGWVHEGEDHKWERPPDFITFEEAVVSDAPGAVKWAKTRREGYNKYMREYMRGWRKVREENGLHIRKVPFRIKGARVSKPKPKQQDSI